MAESTSTSRPWRQASRAITRFASELNRDGIDGLIYLGFHFRTADRVAINMMCRRGSSNWGLNHYFQPIIRRKDRAAFGIV